MYHLNIYNKNISMGKTQYIKFYPISMETIYNCDIFHFNIACNIFDIIF